MRAVVIERVKLAQKKGAFPFAVPGGICYRKWKGRAGKVEWIGNEARKS